MKYLLFLMLASCATYRRPTTYSGTCHIPGFSTFQVDQATVYVHDDKFFVQDAHQLTAIDSDLCSLTRD